MEKHEEREQERRQEMHQAKLAAFQAHARLEAFQAQAEAKLTAMNQPKCRKTREEQEREDEETVWRIGQMLRRSNRRRSGRVRARRCPVCTRTLQ